MKRILIIIIAASFVLGCDFGRSVHCIEVEGKLIEKQVDFPDAPFGTYKCCVSVKGHSVCELSAHITINSMPYNDSIGIGKGRISQTIFNGDWYGDKMGVLLQAADPIGKSELEIKVIYYY